MKKIYIASPYSSKSIGLRQLRYEQACEAAAYLMQRGYVVFSPIAHSHNISKYLGNGNDCDFYLKQDLPLIEWADELWVLMLEGWQESNGIAAEIKYAITLGKPVQYFNISGGKLEVLS